MKAIGDRGDLVKTSRSDEAGRAALVLSEEEDELKALSREATLLSGESSETLNTRGTKRASEDEDEPTTPSAATEPLKEHITVLNSAWGELPASEMRNLGAETSAPARLQELADAKRASRSRERWTLRTESAPDE